MLRKLRGALGLALTWAVAWGLGGFLLGVLLYLVGPGFGPIPFWSLAPLLALRTGMLGFVGGGAFAVVLGTIHRKRRLGELGSFRMALWGALAGLVMPVAGIATIVGATGGGIPIRAILGPAVVVFGGLGAATSVMTIKLAQRSVDGLESPEAEDMLPR